MSVMGMDSFSAPVGHAVAAPMTIFQEILLAWLCGGVVVAVALVVIAVRRFRWLGQVSSLLTATVVLWFSLAAGVSHGYGAWQTSPNPPDEAFADGAALTGSVMFGWLPAGLFCVVCWAAVAAPVLLRARTARHRGA